MFYEKRIGRFFLPLVLTVSVVCVVPLRAQQSVKGEWTGVLGWEIEAIHTIMLPTGKMMVWKTSASSARLWDPVTELFSSIAIPDYNIFCAGHAWLPDGRLLVVGGQLPSGSSSLGEPRADIYDPFTDTWAGNLPDMNGGRWYPSATTLANGDVLVMSGLMDGSGDENPLPQVYEVATNSWRDLTTASKIIPTYPRTFLAPDGRVVSLANKGSITEIIDTSGTGQWSYLDDLPFPYGYSYGSAVMYEPGKIAFFGGGSPPTENVRTFDLNVQNPQWASAGTMAQPRRQHDATILADGTVLITGGTSESGFNDPAGSIATVELWDPDTGLITEVADASSDVYRGYHTTTTLLYDGRVLMTGGDSTLGVNSNAEIYSPAYLFNGTRPTITSAPESAGLGSTFFVETPDAADIAEITFLVPGAVTHSQNWTQRISYLEFTEVAGGLYVTLPSNPNEAPPGYYMLFLLNNDGVPSVAEFVRLSSVSGDFDADNDVDGFDFLKWQRGVTSASDLADWEANYGAGSGALAASAAFVPELSTALLFCIGMVVGLHFRSAIAQNGRIPSGAKTSHNDPATFLEPIRVRGPGEAAG